VRRNIMDSFEEKFEQLMREFAEQREALKAMIDELEKVKNKIERLFPESLDNRYVRFFEEKVKAATGIFTAILEIRKEVIKSLKDETEMRRKFAQEAGEMDSDIRRLAKSLEAASQVEGARSYL